MAKGKSSGLAASKANIDKSLDDLFASSSGPVKAPASSRYSELLPLKEHKPLVQASTEAAAGSDDEDEEDDEELSELDEELDDDEDGPSDGPSDAEEEEDSASAQDDSEDEAVQPEPTKKDRKRKRKDDFEDLEDKYLQKLAEDDEHEEKRRKGDAESSEKVPSKKSEAGADGDDDEEQDDTPIVHESLLKKAGEEEHADVELDKANRTLFLGNVSAEAINSSKAKKELMTHLASPLADLDASSGPHKIESIRFRSVATAGGGMPKRAAFITKSLMETTTKSANAYAVYSTPLAARTALKALNGTVVLDRHLRADSVAHPAQIAHRRCVFVGNLGFVDDETVLTTDADGETKTKKRTKVPADFEEGLWRIFGQHAGKVESVRLPRDPKTRVGKGFAYVQFYDANDVEGALLLDGKKFPPMLPRILRVSRAKDPKKTALAVERTNKAKLEAAKGSDGAAGKPKSTKYKHKATPEQKSLAGRASRLFGRAGAAREAQRLKGGEKKPRHRDSKAGGDGVDLSTIKTPEQIVFEGRRASSKDGKPKDLKFGKVKGKKRPPLQAKKRGARRAAEWKKSGGRN
ncbi:hypothetical protein PFICI_01177 [Pestalotiopsis fici W106-1]|uniref:Nucleolar protein 12 n=1 Tax=Pestalotiopsis fici (strain W106-1 / CGMCC3.15140) TaxID=1229662 RepID=W3XMY7_PESFW|nr:uncharacterized protein PFICI_01177 [Pestalotiopsis fici W106-1]ETS87349.1 hypothetical protein PFICI_01177 [Pestalotiopsis fici W106-1]